MADNAPTENGANVLGEAQGIEEGQHLQELRVVGVVDEGLNGNSVVGKVAVCVRRVVDD